MREHQPGGQTGLFSIAARFASPRKAKVNDFCTLRTWWFDAADSMMIDGDFLAIDCTERDVACPATHTQATHGPFPRNPK
jgi:hypothetical protein